jgi:predicted transcriptional regulator
MNDISKKEREWIEELKAERPDLPDWIFISAVRAYSKNPELFEKMKKQKKKNTEPRKIIDGEVIITLPDGKKLGGLEEIPQKESVEPLTINNSGYIVEG